MSGREGRPLPTSCPRRAPEQLKATRGIAVHRRHRQLDQLARLEASEQFVDPGAVQMAEDHARFELEHTVTVRLPALRSSAGRADARLVVARAIAVVVLQQEVADVDDAARPQDALN